MLGTNHCGELQRTAFKRRELFQDVLCCHDYAERVVETLLLKSNHNNMVEIDQCLYRVLNWNVLVRYHRQISINQKYHVNVMQYFNIFI